MSFRKIFSLWILAFVLPLSLLSQTVTLPTRPPIDAFSFSYATGATNQTKITVTALDRNRNAIPFVDFSFWLSDSASGNPVTATPGSFGNGIQILGSIGTIIQLTTNTAMLSAIAVYDVRASNVGTVQFGVTDSAKTGWFPVARPRGPSSSVAVGAKLVTANYGIIDMVDFVNHLTEILMDYINPRSRVFMGQPLTNSDYGR